MSSTSKLYQVVCCASLLFALSPHAYGQIGPGSGTNINAGPFTSLFNGPFQSTITRRPTGVTQRCNGPTSLANDDVVEYVFGTAGIGAPFQIGSAPSFVDNSATVMSTVLIDDADVLANPGTHYNSVLWNNPSAQILNLSGPLPNNGSTSYTASNSLLTRFGGGFGAYDDYTFTGSVIDKKGTSTGASYGAFVAEQTYEIDPAAFNGSFGGALAFDVRLPKAIYTNQQPGAAAVSLVTTMITSEGTQFTPAGGDTYELNCLRMASVVASVSEGIADGRDNQNTGPQENYFGNADVATIMGNPAFDVNGLATISSTQQSLSSWYEDYQVAASWVTPNLKFGNFANKPVYVTFRHTLTMIADPGAEIALRAMTPDEFDVLPTNANVFLTATGSLVPEPSSLLLCGGLMISAVSAGRRRLLRA